MTSGERRFAQRLQDKLEDDYLCWYDVPIGPSQLHPDFVILHPRRGLLILEVKDWKLDTIKAADRKSVTLVTDRGLKAVPNPLEQARSYALAVSDLLQGDPLLRVEAGRYQGRLCVPYGFGVVLANIHRKAFAEAGLDQVIEPHRVICQDEMFESVDPEAFQKRLWEMSGAPFVRALSLPQVDRIRWHLFPEVRITGRQLSLVEEPGKEDPSGATVPHLLRVMDLQQEQLARSLGEGHRIIHGVAGSGKTLILGYRCERLAGALQKPVLVLCYNAALAAMLRHVMQTKRLAERVSVRTFHAWCRDQLRLFHVPLPPEGEGFFDELVERVIHGVDRGQIPRAQYGAVLIDEGHDFKPEWFRLVAQMVDPQTNSLLVLYDDAQSIYERRARRNFSFSSVGIQAKGRTTILRVNYRNTQEVLSLAYEFAREAMTPEEANDDGIPLILPESAGRHGPRPVVRGHASLKDEAEFIARELREANRGAGRAWREMAVVYRSAFVGEEIVRRLRAAGVPVQWLGEPNHRRLFDPAEDSVKVLTMHSSKGLEFPVVAIPGLGYMPHPQEEPADEAKLLYVAMTRAMDLLLLTYHRETEFVARLRQAHARLAA